MIARTKLIRINQLLELIVVIEHCTQKIVISSVKGEIEVNQDFVSTFINHIYAKHAMLKCSFSL